MPHFLRRKGQGVSRKVAQAARADIPVRITSISDGEKVGPGSRITLVSEVQGLVEGAQVSYQWQNNASGSYVDVPGANGSTYAYTVNEGNADSTWRVLISVYKG